MSNIHRISLFLQSLNIRGDGLINIEFFTYTLKLVIVVFQGQITKTQGKIILMKITNSLQIANTRVKLLGLFPNKFNSWYENQTTTDLKLHAIPQATSNLCIFGSPISIFRVVDLGGSLIM